MLESLNATNEFEYQKLTLEEQTSRGILGRLKGIIADFLNPTRNGRLYSEELWDNVFDNDIMKEKIANHCVFGELGHPEDRTETDMSKIAICLADVPKKGNDGKLYGIFDILNTPNGRILKALCEYGCTIGVSSRGEGDLISGYDGQESVDPETYSCECWDAVLLPAVKDARMQLVTESLNNNKSLKQALQESLDNSSESDREIMTETLHKLGILNETYTIREIDNSFVVVDSEDRIVNKFDKKEDAIEYANSLEYNSDNEDETTIPEKDLDTDDAVDNTEVDNNDSMVEELQSLISQNRTLEAQVISLNEQLSVCHAKELSNNETLGKLRESISQVHRQYASLSAHNKQLQDELEKYKNATVSYKKVAEDLRSGILEERADVNESLKQKDTDIKQLNELLNSSSSKITTLTEKLTEVQKDLELSKKNLSIKSTKSNELVEHYKKIAVNCINYYINSQAKILGISAKEIKQKLPKNYNFDDINRICESLQTYKVNMNKLPFNTMLNESLPKAQFRNVNDKLLVKNDNMDDMVDDQLLSLAGMN